MSQKMSSITLKKAQLKLSRCLRALTKSAPRWQTLMQITTSCYLKWESCKSSQITAMHGNQIHNQNKLWMHFVAHLLMQMFLFYLVVKNVALLCVSCCYKHQIYCFLMSLQTTWMQNLFCGLNSTLISMPAQLLRLLTIDISWTTLHSGFLNSTVVVHIHMKEITRPTQRQKLHVLRQKVRKMQSVQSVWLKNSIGFAKMQKVAKQSQRLVLLVMKKWLLRQTRCVSWTLKKFRFHLAHVQEMLLLKLIT